MAKYLISFPSAAMNVPAVATLLLSAVLCMTGCAGPGNAQPQPAHAPPADAIVLRVSVRKAESTGRFPECGEGCIPWSSWYRYHAEVREVLGGDFDERTVEFVFLQHAEFVRAVTRDCYVVLTPADPGIATELGVGYVAERLLSRRIEHHAADIEALRNLP